MSISASSNASPAGDRIVELLILWGEHSVLHAAHLRPGQRFVLGDPEATEEHVDFTLPASVLGAPSFALLDADDDATTRVQLPPGAEGVLARAGQVTALAAGSALNLEANDQLSCTWQGFQLQIRELEPSDAAELVAPARWQLKDHRWTLGSLGFHALFLILFQFLPSAAHSLNLDDSALESRLVKVYLEAQSVEDPEPLFTEPGPDASESGEAAPDDEGQAGDPKHKPTHNKSSGAATPARTSPTHDELKELASTMGISQVLRALPGPANNLFSDRPPGMVEGAAMLGAISGDLLGANFGPGGLGARGTGHGGGGPPNGTIGVGKLGTRGGIGFGKPVGLGPRTPRGGPTIRRLPPEVVGGLSKEVIRREIGRHLNEVRFCYEQGLRTRPELQGRVTVKFAIGPTGSVLSAGVLQDELNAPAVALCISAATKRWQFPSPEGSGTVLVSYPFLLEQP